MNLVADEQYKIKSLVKCYFGCYQGFHCKRTVSFYFVFTLLLLVKRKISKYILLFFIVVIDCRPFLTCVSDGLYQTCVLWFGAEIARITCLILWKSGLLIPRYEVFLLEALCWYLSNSYWGVKVLWHWGGRSIGFDIHRALKSQYGMTSFDILDVLNCKIEESLCTNFKKHVFKSPKNLTWMIWQCFKDTFKSCTCMVCLHLFWKWGDVFGRGTSSMGYFFIYYLHCSQKAKDFSFRLSFFWTCAMWAWQFNQPGIW